MPMSAGINQQQQQQTGGGAAGVGVGGVGPGSVVGGGGGGGAAGGAETKANCYVAAAHAANLVVAAAEGLQVSSIPYTLNSKCRWLRACVSALYPTPYTLHPTPAIFKY